MLLFLDIDGVMIPAKSWERPELLDDGFPAFSTKATRVLQDLVSDDTTIMLTTSHKSNYTLDEWKHIFEKRSINVKNLVSLPENVNHLSRKDEILNWFDAHDDINENFVIVDDDKSLNALPAFLKNHLVLTSSMVGLTERHLDEIKLVLDKGLQAA